MQCNQVNIPSQLAKFIFYKQDANLWKLMLGMILLERDNNQYNTIQEFLFSLRIHLLLRRKTKHNREIK